MYTLRPIQIDVIERAMAALSAGKKHIFIEAPTGTGKSIIGLELSRRLNSIDPTLKSYMLTAEKALQKQYEDTVTEHQIPSVVSISGVDNYFCGLNGQKFSLGVCKAMGLSNAKALQQMACARSCEYLVRWTLAKDADIAVFNYSYYFIQMNYVLRRLMEYAPFQRRPVVIADEAHRLPELIEAHFHATVDNSLVTLIKECQDRLREDEVKVQFLGVRWSELARLVNTAFKVPYREKADQLEALRYIYHFLVNCRERIADSKLLLQRMYNIDLGEEMDVVTAWQERSARIPASVFHFNKVADVLKDFTCKIEDYIEIIDNFGLDSMVITGGGGKRVYRIFNDEALFKKFYEPHGEKFIYMSATLQPEVLMRRLGITADEAEIITASPGWDPALAPIIVRPTADFRHANVNALEDSLQDIDDILKKHRNQRGIIHTTSYALANQIATSEKLSHHRSRFLVYRGSTEKQELLNELSRSAPNAVILAPSMSEGVDLRDDLARFQIICKISYPNVSDALWQKRSRKQRYVYMAAAVNTLIQQCGRPVRSDVDHATTYILDSRFKKNYNRLKRYFTPEFTSRLVPH